MKTISFIIYTTVTTVTLLCVAMVGVQSAGAATITVTNTNDSGAGSLRQAIGDANSGDTIEFSVTTPATITLTSGALVVPPGKSLTITGPSSRRLTVNGNAVDSVFRIGGWPEANVTISNLTIAKGADGYGGGIVNEGNGLLTINNCTISGNGDIFNADTTLFAPRTEDRPSNYWQIVYVEGFDEPLEPRTAMIYGRTMGEALEKLRADAPEAEIRCIARESFYLCEERLPQ